MTKEFKGFRAVNGVALAILRGTIHGLIGAGKTTCFNLLAKVLGPTADSIHDKGRDISRRLRKPL